MKNYNTGKFIINNEKKIYRFFKRIKEYLSNVSIARQIINRELPEFIKLTNGDIYDIGGYSKELQKLTNNGKYLLLDIVDNGNIDLNVNAENMPFNDNSIDNFVCISVMEHTNEPEKIISEIYRCLKYKGKVYLSVPFLFETHMEPEDFYRFTIFYLNKTFDKFNILSVSYTNNYFGLISHFLQKKSIFKYTLGMIFLILELLQNRKTYKYATQINYILQKI